MLRSERTVRGYSHLLLARYIEEKLAPDLSARVKAELSDVWSRLPAVKEDSASSFDDWAAMLRAIAAVDETPEQGYQRVFEAGTFVANHALSTALRLLVRFLRPSIFARKLTDLWNRDHNFGKLVARMGATPNTMVLDVLEVDGYPFAAPLVSGWVFAALTTMGCKDIQWREVLHPLPEAQELHDRYQVEFTWR